jgi:hypothetical protein
VCSHKVGFSASSPPQTARDDSKTHLPSSPELPGTLLGTTSIIL